MAGHAPVVVGDDHAARGPRPGPVRVRAATRPAPSPRDVADRGRHAGRDVNRLRPAPLRRVDPPWRKGTLALGRLGPPGFWPRGPQGQQSNTRVAARLAEAGRE